MASDHERIVEVRKQLGLQNEAQFSEDELYDELETAKEQVSEEIRQRLNEGATLDYDGAQEQALEAFLTIRAHDRVHGRGRGPKTVSHMRRFDFEDSDMSFQRDKLVKALGRIE